MRTRNRIHLAEYGHGDPGYGLTRLLLSQVWKSGDRIPIPYSSRALWNLKAWAREAAPAQRLNQDTESDGDRLHVQTIMNWGT
jgi:hypothetical protein